MTFHGINLGSVLPNGGQSLISNYPIHNIYQLVHIG